MRITMRVTKQGAIAAFGRRAVNDVVRAAFAAAGDHWGPKAFSSSPVTGVGVPSPSDGIT